MGGAGGVGLPRATALDDPSFVAPLVAAGCRGGGLRVAAGGAGGGAGREICSSRYAEGAQPASCWFRRLASHHPVDFCQFDSTLNVVGHK